MKKIFALVLVLVMLLSVFTACNDEAPGPDDRGMADTGDTSAEQNDGEEGEASKPEANPITDFEYSYSERYGGIGITKYVGTSKSIVFPDTIEGLPVAIIGGFVLASESNMGDLIESVVIPDTVEIIAPMAFWGCKNLVSVDFGEGVREIQEQAFMYCTSLEKIILPPKLESIGADAFSYCTAVKEIFIPKSVTSWNYNAGDYGLFSGYEKPSALTKITIEDGLVSLGSKYGSGMFCNAPLLEELVIPASIKLIEPYAFDSCTGLKSVKFLGDAPEVDENLFGYVGTVTSSENLVIYYDPATKGWDDTPLRQYMLVPIK